MKRSKERKGEEGSGASLWRFIEEEKGSGKSKDLCVVSFKVFWALALTVGREVRKMHKRLDHKEDETLTEY